MLPLFHRIVNTPYEVVMAEDITCRLLCHKPSKLMTWDEANSQHVIQMVQHEYFVHLLASHYYSALQDVCIILRRLYPGFFFFQIDR